MPMQRFFNCLLAILIFPLAAMAAEPIELNEVVVSASIVRHEPTKDVVTVTNEMRKGTIRAVDMLARVPGVSVNPITHQVDVDGYRNVAIFLDGNPVSAEYVRGINPKRIARVEVIRVPTGQYAGYEIALNIVLKNDFEGWDVDAQGEGTLSLKNNHSNAIAGLVNATISSKKLNIYGQFYGNHDRNYSSRAYERTIFGEVYQTVPADDHNPNRKTDDDNGVFFLASDYKFRQNQTITAQLYASTNRNSADSRYDFVDSPIEHTNQHGHTNDLAAILMYTGRFGGRLSVYAYVQYQNHSESSDQLLKVGDNITGTTNLKNRSVFVNPVAVTAYTINEENTVMFTEKFQYRNYISRDAENGNTNFSSDDSRNSAEVAYVWRPSQQFNIVGSGTLLSVRTTNRAGQQEYVQNVNSFEPFISAFLKFAKDYTARLQYRYALSYPGLNMLSPAIYMDGPNFYRTGNPDLKRTISTVVYGTLSFKSLLTVEYFHSHQHNAIYYGYEPYGNDAIIGVYTNCGKTENAVTLTSRFKLGKDVSLNISGKYSRTAVSSYGAERCEAGNSYSVFGSVVYNIEPWATTAFAEFDFGWQQNPYLMGMYKYQTQKLSFGMRRSFFAKRLAMTLSYECPMPLRRFNESVETSEDFYYKQQVSNYVNNSRLMLRVNLTIGNQKSSKVGNAFDIGAAH